MISPQPVRSTRAAPEVLGVMLAAIIYSVVGVGIIVASTVPPEPPPPPPTSSPVAVTPRPVPTMSASLVLLIRDTNARILALGKELEVLLVDDPIVTADVIDKIKQISTWSTFAIGIVDRIAIQPGGASIAPTLRTAYEAIVDAADKALSSPFADRVAIRKGAEGVLLAVAELPDIDALLQIAQATASPGSSTEPSPSPTGSAAASPSPSPTPSPTPAATPTPAPTPKPTPTPGSTPSASVSPSPIPPSPGPNQLANGGFESGLDPWRLVLATGAAGTLERTTTDHFSGAASAVVTVTAGAGSPSTVSVEQGGLTLESGQTYVMSIAVRSAADREIRIRLSTGLGEVIASRVLPVTTTWTIVSFPVTPIGRFQNVTLMVEVGASGQRIWLDDVSLG